MDQPPIRGRRGRPAHPAGARLPAVSSAVDGHGRVEVGGWTVRIGSGRMEIESGVPERPTVRVTADAQTVSEVFRGDRSGVEAFLLGRLRVRGNLALALRLDSMLNPD